VAISPAGANVVSLAVSPNYQNDHTLFAAPRTQFDLAGVLKSTNGGLSWTAVNAGITNLTTVALAISPAYGQDQTIFLATLGGLFRSKNGGALWTRLTNGMSEPVINALAMSPAFTSDRSIFAATGSGVFASVDGGDSWAPANNGITDNDGRLIPAGFLEISPNFANDRTLFAGTPQYEVGGGLFKTTNAGVSWQVVNNGIPQYFSGITALRISPAYAGDHTVFAGVWSNRVYRSIDSGASWQPANNGIPSQPCRSSSSMSLLPPPSMAAITPSMLARWRAASSAQ